MRRSMADHWRRQTWVPREMDKRHCEAGKMLSGLRDAFLKSTAPAAADESQELCSESPARFDRSATFSEDRTNSASSNDAVLTDIDDTSVLQDMLDQLERQEQALAAKHERGRLRAKQPLNVVKAHSSNSDSVLPTASNLLSGSQTRSCRVAPVLRARPHLSLTQSAPELPGVPSTFWESVAFVPAKVEEETSWEEACDPNRLVSSVEAADVQQFERPVVRQRNHLASGSMLSSTSGSWTSARALGPGVPHPSRPPLPAEPARNLFIIPDASRAQANAFSAATTLDIQPPPGADQSNSMTKVAFKPEPCSLALSCSTRKAKKEEKVKEDQSLRVSKARLMRISQVARASRMIRRRSAE